MKRILTFASVLVLTAGMVFADQNVLIDFAKLVSDIQVSGQDENKQTLMDFSHATIGASFTDEQRSRLKTSLLLKNWVVELTSSSQTVVNNSLSFTKEATSKAFFEGPVLGVRVHFPVEPFQSWALVKPPFEIPAYAFDTINDDGSTTPPGEDTNFHDKTRFEDGYGVLKNVGAIKSIAVNVYGLNFPHLLSVVYINDQNERKIMPIGYLNYEGWAQLTWENPAYIEHVRARTMRLYPLYPSSSNYIKFAGFLIQRDAAGPGGDFVTYFKDVQVIYDKAVLDPEGADIDDEAEWHVLRDREDSRAKHESERFGVEQVLRFIETQKQATETWGQTGVANQVQ
jgi:hypothetical protein